MPIKFGLALVEGVMKGLDILPVIRYNIRGYSYRQKLFSFSGEIRFQANHDADFRHLIYDKGE